MRIKKVINNNILCVIDEKGHESIVTGRGLGFGRKVGQFVDSGGVEKIYRMEDKTGQRRLRELVEQIPLEHLHLTEQMIETIRSEIRQPLNESLLITLADHISFAIQRKAQGDITRLIDGAVEVVEYFYRDLGTFDRESLDFSRFVIHLRYFAQRLFQDKMIPDSTDEGDAAFREMIARSCALHYKCAQCVAEYVRNTWHKELSQEELIYLTIHLKRVAGGLRRDAASDVTP